MGWIIVFFIGRSHYKCTAFHFNHFRIDIGRQPFAKFYIFYSFPGFFAIFLPDITFDEFVEVKEGPDAGQPLYYECNWGIGQGKPIHGYEAHPAIYITSP